MNLEIPLQLVLIGLLAFLCQWGAWRIKLPAILPLLVSGLLLGPITGALDPAELFGDMLLPGVSLAVAVILFEGAMTLRLDEIRGVGRVVWRLIILGGLITWAVVTLGAWWLVDAISLEAALLLGALVVVTGPTVIVPMLRSVRPVSSVSRLLRWEGIIIDPLGALLAVLAFEIIVATGAEAVQQTLLVLVQSLGLGTLLGVLVALGLAFLLRRHLVPEYLRSFLVLSAILAEFVLSNMLVHESGLLAVTVTGMVLANSRGVNTRDVLHFKENLSVMLISALFIVLAARIEMQQLAEFALPALIVLGLVQLVARPLAVWVATLGSNLNWREKSLLAWIAPRGIVAAAVSALFAERLAQNDVAGADMLVPLTFAVIIGTVALQSVTARPLAQLLNVAVPAPRGLLIIGANPVARAVGEALKQNGFPVLLADSSWEHSRAARMRGLPVYYGHSVSQYADRALDLVGFGRMLGMSMRRELNTLAAMRYRMEFGEQNVYSLAPSAEQEEKITAVPDYPGNTLFAPDITYTRFASLLDQGAVVRKTRLTAAYNFDAYLDTPGRQVWPLFGIDPRGWLHVFSVEEKPRPQPGWHILGLILEESDQQAPESGEEVVKARARERQRQKEAKAARRDKKLGYNRGHSRPGS
jgi:NhaP-type Na+/H+ or K+/H+ antiporter